MIKMSLKINLSKPPIPPIESQDYKCNLCGEIVEVKYLTIFEAEALLLDHLRTKHLEELRA